MVNRDSFSLVISCAERMVMEKMGRLQETSRVQVGVARKTSNIVGVVKTPRGGEVYGFKQTGPWFNL